MLVQELALTEATLIFVYHSGFNLWMVHAIWLAATIIDITIGFYVGRYLKNRLAGFKWFNATIGKWSVKFKGYVGQGGKALALVLLGLFLFPYFAAFLAAWFDVDFTKAIIFVSLGNLVWYLFVLGTALGINFLVPNIKLAITLVILAVVIIDVFSRLMRKRSIIRE
jgi:membrane protein YqaA with SNARE-associated domain